MSKLSYIMEYEEILLGNRKNFSTLCMGKEAHEKDAIVILKYAIEELLHWTPEMARDYMNSELIKLLHLQRPVIKLDFPPELDETKDFFYIAQAVYPKRIRYSQKKIVLSVYQKVAEKLQPKYPKNFFSGTRGLTNACICLQFAMNQNLVIESVEELYRKFSDKSWATAFLKDVRLYTPFLENYQYPIDFLHDSLPETQKSDFFYHFYRFQTDYAVARGKMN